MRVITSNVSSISPLSCRGDGKTYPRYSDLVHLHEPLLQSDRQPLQPPDEIRWKSLSSDDHVVLLNHRRSSFYFRLILSLNATHKIGCLKDLTIEDFLTIPLKG